MTRAVVVACCVALVACLAPAARPATQATLAARLAVQRAAVRKDTSTLRFFANHPRILWSGPLRTRALAKAIVRRRKAHLAWTLLNLRRNERVLERLSLAARIDSLGPTAAIRYVFVGACPAWGSYGSCADQALVVAWCESRLTLSDPTGQHLGLFQMGDWERSTYAYGAYSTAVDQARAAWRYFVATGKDWSPWSCKPDGSIRSPG